IEMEFIEGPDMEELLKVPNDPVFSIKETIKVADQLSFALAHCHKVNVKHGDIKSNNVKFNINTGNYILLDFGLAIMSEDQRRTSMRQVGAIEFMAPEQNDGLMFFQSDIYSFGIILYELLAGTVPFPLRDKSETARNKVMLAHLERTVPDLLPQRRERMPDPWSEERRDREMQVPQWLIDAIYKCLEKSPQDRFKDGQELHQYIVHHSTLAAGNKEASALNLQILQKENERLRTLVLQYQEEERHRDPSGVISHKVLSVNEALSSKINEVFVTEAEPSVARRRNRPLIGALMFFIILAGTAGAMYQFRNKIPFLKKPLASFVEKKKVTPPKAQPVSYVYKVTSAKAFFHTIPDETARRAAYLLPSAELLKPMRETADFIYIEFTNKWNKISKGWLRKKDLVTFDANTNLQVDSPAVENEGDSVQDDKSKIASY
ncbi:MAG: protein kinase, partial [Ferruginibacter sp.]|nr:protein kinase [Ferruginibacter sp.]